MMDNTSVTPRVNEEENLVVEGARVHNLKNISVAIPHDALTVVTGLSGSGKSSLAFDVIYAEGQRRYMETLSAYARQFLGALERPDVDYVGGLAPVIAIEQRTTGRNKRSTVGTITELYDFLRLLYSRVATAYSPTTGEPMVAHTDEQILHLVLQAFQGQKVAMCVPLVRGRKGEYESLFRDLIYRGFLYVRVDGEIRELVYNMKLSRYSVHDIDLVIDRFTVTRGDVDRLRKALVAAINDGKGVVYVAPLDGGPGHFFSRKLMCPVSGYSLRPPEPHTFSFNSPYGQCKQCMGLGYRYGFTAEGIIREGGKPLTRGALQPVIENPTHRDMLSKILLTWLEKSGLESTITFDELGPKLQHELFWGRGGAQEVSLMDCYRQRKSFPGLIPLYDGYYAGMSRRDISPEVLEMMVQTPCQACGGARLNEEALCFKVDGKTISQASEMSLIDFSEWVQDLESRLPGEQAVVAQEIMKEIRSRLGFLIEVGLGYLSLNRPSDSLSGGESQRIRLATQVGTSLVNVLYILDEPSIGLHPRDNSNLIESLKKLRDLGNSVIVVEHDEDMMRASDYLVDLGPGAGRNGGQVVAAGRPEEVLAGNSLTAQYLRGERRIEVPAQRRAGSGNVITIRGARGNNLKNVTVQIPLGKFICVTGVSGSGKSTLINDTLHPILSQRLYRSLRPPLPYDAVEGVDLVDKVIQVDQSPLGRTPRSNPATYTGVFTDIRKLYSMTQDAMIRGYKPGRFSFNVAGGRCENCKGAGYESIEMNFLPDVLVRCSHCHGERYNRETLAVRYKGKNISQVLDMTINRAAEFFAAVPVISRKLESLRSVGLGYVKLGQPCTTLSGGESQRVRLATELSKKASGRTLYILDEPTTGLHFEDIRLLLSVIDSLVDLGNTVVVIEHNLDVIKHADHIIDLGPDSGERGGELIVCGTPEEVALSGLGYTSQFLQDLL